jgi:oxalate decarboxylase/phosphoglucose isomerase-like protein (cupin superfamily)
VYNNIKNTRGKKIPVLSLFYGIVVSMYKEVSGKHHKPHIHVEYAEDEVVVALDGEILEG